MTPPPSSAVIPAALAPADRWAAERIVVAVPARDEAASIAACLRSIDRAARLVTVPVVVVVAADSCADDTAAVARAVDCRHATVLVVEGTWGRAGAARAAAVLAAGPEVGAAPFWLANTDADCVVPEGWLAAQLGLSADHHAVAGIVDLDADATPAHLLRAFRLGYRCAPDTHSHVHGANLGLRGDTYARVGGWCPVTVVGEDHRMWQAVVAAGLPAVQSTAVVVTTSARTRSRVEGGFATDLRILEETRGG